MSDTAIVKLEAMTAIQIFEPGAIDPVIEAIEAEARSEAAKLDISTEVNRKALASLSYKVARSKTFIDNQRKALVTDEKRRLAKIDEEGRRVWNRLEALQNEIRQPLTEWENADKLRIAAHEARIAEIQAIGQTCALAWQSASLASMESDLANVEAQRDWQEFGSRGALAVKTAGDQIRDAIAKRQAYDAEQAELARLRAEAAEREKKEREERIAREAREKAEREAAERAEQERRKAELEQARIEAEKKQAEARAKAAEEARIAAEEKAKRDAEAAEQRRIAEAKAAEERAERQRLQAIEDERKRVAEEQRKQHEEQERRERNSRHVKAVNSEVERALLNQIDGLTPVAAQEIVAAIASQSIPHVIITY